MYTCHSLVGKGRSLGCLNIYSRMMLIREFWSFLSPESSRMPNGIQKFPSVCGASISKSRRPSWRCGGDIFSSRMWSDKHWIFETILKNHTLNGAYFLFKSLTFSIKWVIGRFFVPPALKMRIQRTPNLNSVLFAECFFHNYFTLIFSGFWFSGCDFFFSKPV